MVFEFLIDTSLLTLTAIQYGMHSDCGGKLHEGQQDCVSVGRSCMDNVYVVIEVVQGKLMS